MYTDALLITLRTENCSFQLASVTDKIYSEKSEPSFPPGFSSSVSFANLPVHVTTESFFKQTGKFLF